MQQQFSMALFIDSLLCSRGLGCGVPLAEFADRTDRCLRHLRRVGKIAKFYELPKYVYQVIIKHNLRHGPSERFSKLHVSSEFA